MKFYFRYGGLRQNPSDNQWKSCDNPIAELTLVWSITWVRAGAENILRWFCGWGELVTGNNWVTFHFMSQQCFQANQIIWIVLFSCYKNMLPIHYHAGTYRSMALELVENLFEVNIAQWRVETHICYHHHKPCLYVWFCCRRRISAQAPLLHVDSYIFLDPHRYIGTAVHNTLWRYLNW